MSSQRKGCTNVLGDAAAVTKGDEQKDWLTNAVDFLANLQLEPVTEGDEDSEDDYGEAAPVKVRVNLTNLQRRRSKTTRQGAISHIAHGP